MEINNSFIEVKIYEPHGFFKHDNIYIVYDHESIWILDADTGKELNTVYTR